MKYPYISAKIPGMIHGADYNPDQWLKRPDILAEDITLMREAGCNVMSVGIFAWAALEPEEGRFRFDWLDRVMDELAAAGIHVILATPSGGRPHWLSYRYPEVQRVTAERRRRRPGGRHNHCYTSPLFREKVRIINTRLAERYRDHTALLMWHLSNEYGGECHCHFCQEAFRDWLKRRYHNSLKTLNQAWWTAFWSHTYGDWGQIESPSPLGETDLPGLNLDWKRFVTDQTVDFIREEMAPLREITPGIPVTTNLMGTYPGLDYRRLAAELDVISWDSYPCWHGAAEGEGGTGDWRLAADTGFSHSLMRSLKQGRPFMLMESSPSTSNWHPVQKLKRPGMHVLSSLLAVAHGSDTVQYFQWRQSRGGCEKFHGAVLDHGGSPRARIFREVAGVGSILGKLGALAGARLEAETALIFDWENRWALEAEAAPRHDGLKAYEQTCKNHHLPLWARGIPVDVIGMDDDFSGYRLLIAPMLYMVRPEVAESLERFLTAGGTVVVTYWSGRVDENDLCFSSGFPGPLRSLLGVCCEEIDSLYPEERNRVLFSGSNPLGLAGEYAARHFCALIRAETARVLAVYGDNFYRGRPALTVNTFGKGEAWFLASRNEQRFLNDFYRALSDRLNLVRPLQAEPPEGVAVQSRTDGEKEYLFVLNFSPQVQAVDLGGEKLRDMLSGKQVRGSLNLEALSFRILQRPH
jgi:beta-galactosidase